LIHLTIDGREVEAEPGTLIVDAAKAVGIDIPVFCYHPRMSPAAACRMCLVAVEKMPKLQPACATPVAEGMVVSTDTPAVRKARAGVLEFLLANHPLDCPICDKGGECDLQDNSMRYGPDLTRFADSKRHLDKARPLGPIVELDQERCIQCMRCVRFMEEVAGDPVLTLHDRGGHAVVDVADGLTFDSIFSGNTIEICPVGALTSRPFRFKARPWDLDEIPSVCPHCPVGCNIRLSVRRGEVKRLRSRDSQEIDWGWLCDRGRFGYGFIHEGARLERPLVREAGEQREVSWSVALARLGEGMRGSTGALGGGRSSLEAQYGMRRWLRERVGTKNIDHRVLPLTTAIAPGPQGRIDDLDDADLCIALDVEILEEAPVLGLRMRHFGGRGLRIVSVGPRTGLLDMDHDEVVAEDVAAALAAVARGEGEIGAAFRAARKVLMLWNGRGADVAQAIEAAQAARDGETYAMVVGGLGNSFGAEAVGLVPEEGGLDARGMLEAAARGDLDALFVLESDLSEFPDPDLLAAALERVPFLAVAGSIPTELARRADVVLPLAAWAESDGHLVNMEGRAQRYYAGATRPGGVYDDWRLFAELLGEPLDQGGFEAALRAEFGVLFGPERPVGGKPPRGGDEAQGRALVGASLYHKGVTPDPFLKTLKPPAELALAPDRAQALGVAGGDRVSAGGFEATVRVAAELPPGALLVRAGVAGAGRALAPDVTIQAFAGRAE